MIETAVTKMFRVTKIEEELSYIGPGKTQVKTYNFTNNLGTISIVLFMADEPSNETMALDSRDVSAWEKFRK